MRWLFTDPRCLEHRTGAHPECPQRLERILDRLEQSPVVEGWQRPTWELATDQEIQRVHSAEHVAQVQASAEQGGGRIEADTVVSRQSYDVARLAVGAVTAAVRKVVQGEPGGRAACLIRPPGHHARPTGPMGFCLFNNIAIGAQVAIQELQLNRVLIVDWDVHHGNGTQEIFYRDPQVGFLSIHRSPFYPGTGDSDETGTGPGRGTTLNVPIAMGTSRQDYQQQFRRALEQIANQMQPELVLVSAGFDAHRLDPIGSLGLETSDYTWLTQDLIEVAQAYSQGRIVTVLEGGYNLDVLPDCVVCHLETLGHAAS